MCLCMQSWGEGVHMHMCVGLCKDMKLTWGVFLNQFSTLFFETVCYWTWSSLISLDSNSGGPFFLGILVAGIINAWRHWLAFTWVLGIQTLVRVPAQQALDGVNRLSSPGIVSHCIFSFLLRNLKGLSSPLLITENVYNTEILIDRLEDIGCVWSQAFQSRSLGFLVMVFGSYRILICSFLFMMFVCSFLLCWT